MNRRTRSQDICGYYEDLTAEYQWYGGDMGWHYGLWEAGVRTHRDSLERANVRLVDGLVLDERSRVLDVGCGMGDFARWCSRKFGCAVTGLSISPAHVELATEIARREGLADRCRFMVMDLNDISLPGASFDLVVNQETLCYAADVSAYLAGVFRVLVGGGVWSAIALSRIKDLTDPVAVEQYQATLAGFHIPQLLPAEEIGAHLAAAGFVERRFADLTRLLAPAAREIIGRSRRVLELGSIGLDWLIFPGGPGAYENYRGHFAAGDAYSRGLLSGWARQMQYRAVKPATR
jgi:cyclopropane fatty-acyl-phospholipid synthase-like methyltransferase